MTSDHSTRPDQSVNRIPSTILDDPRLHDTTRRVLIFLVGFASGEREINVSDFDDPRSLTATIAARLGISTASARNSIRRLLEFGFLQYENVGPESRPFTNGYLIFPFIPRASSRRKGGAQ